MIDKEKRIEKMAKVIDDRLIEAKGYLGSMNRGEGYWIAQKLVDLYQPKITENEIVVSKEEYEHINSCYNVIRRQIVREILETIKELYTTPYSCFHENILKVAEKYGVDIKEQRTTANKKCKYFREIDYGYRHSKQCFAQKCAPEVNCNGYMSNCSKYPKITEE